MFKRRAIALFAAVALAAAAQAQSGAALDKGLELYRGGRWRDAIIALRQTAAQATPGVAAEAQYWIALAELASGDYGAALRDLDDLAAKKIPSSYGAEIPYQKGRVLYHLGRFDEALQILKAYADSVSDEARKSAAVYWIGESLYGLGRFDEARAVFSLIIDKYPESVKYEASYYRVALIDQKGRETELLKLLKWSHEESLKTVEEYQKRERSYEQAIVAYQKRIADMLKDTRLADLEEQVRRQNERLASLEAELSGAAAKLEGAERRNAELAAALESAAAAGAPAAAVSAPAPASDAERVARLLAIKADALELRDLISKRISGEEK